MNDLNDAIAVLNGELANDDFYATVSIFDAYDNEEHPRFTNYCKENNYLTLSSINKEMILKFQAKFDIPDERIHGLVSEITSHVISLG